MMKGKMKATVCSILCGSVFVNNVSGMELPGIDNIISNGIDNFLQSTNSNFGNFISNIGAKNTVEEAVKNFGLEYNDIIDGGNVNAESLIIGKNIKDNGKEVSEMKEKSKIFLVSFHGNGGKASEAPLLEEIKKSGRISYFAPEYPGYCDFKDKTRTFDSFLNCVKEYYKQIKEFIKKIYVEELRIVTFSLGGLGGCYLVKLLADDKDGLKNVEGNDVFIKVMLICPFYDASKAAHTFLSKTLEGFNPKLKGVITEEAVKKMSNLDEEKIKKSSNFYYLNSVKQKLNIKPIIEIKTKHNEYKNGLENNDVYRSFLSEEVDKNITDKSKMDFYMVFSTRDEVVDNQGKILHEKLTGNSKDGGNNDCMCCRC